jgi:hypothetical protein
MDQTEEDERQLVDELAARGVPVRSLSDIVWDQPHPEAIPVLLGALEKPIDGLTKLLVLRILGKPWAYGASYPVLLEIFRSTDFSRSDSPVSVWDHRQEAFDSNLIASIARSPAKGLWPQILEYARRPDLGSRASLFLHRAGKFRAHADEVLKLYDEFVGSDSAGIEMSITQGLRRLGDPRGMTILKRVNDITSEILREKARTMDRLQGRD